MTSGWDDAFKVAEREWATIRSDRRDGLVTIWERDFAVVDNADDGCDFTRFTATLVQSANGSAPPCPADWDANGSIDTADFFAFLTSFFAGSADFNSDGLTDSQDLFDYLTSFFDGCQ